MSSSKRYIMGSKRGGGGTVAGRGGVKAAPAVPAAGVGSDDRRLSEYSSPEDVCPVCKTDRYLNPKLRLMVSSCYHKMCESCIDRIFSLGPEPCPVCHTIVRKAQFKPQMFENLGVQKEVAVRTRMAKVFNKREEDFKDLKSYNDYLEEYELLTFNLIHDVDVQQTEQRIRQYEQENRALIEQNEHRQELEAERVKQLEQDERRQKEQARLEYERLDAEEQRQRQLDKDAVLAGLETSTASADAVLKAAKKSSLKRSSARAMMLEQQQQQAQQKGGLSARMSTLLANVVDRRDADKENDDLEDVDAYLAQWDANEALYDVRTKNEGGYAVGAMDADKSDVGGFVVEEVWEKAIRASVTDLFLPPLSV